MGQIHKLGFTLLSLDIIQISKMDFKRISVKSWWDLMAASPSWKLDITTKFRLRKVGVSWRYQQKLVWNIGGDIVWQKANISQLQIYWDNHSFRNLWNYFRYQMDTWNLSWFLIWCQIGCPKMRLWKKWVDRKLWFILGWQELISLL